MPEHRETKDTIEKRGDKYVLLSASGEVLGEHDSEEEARAQERAIEAAKVRSSTADSEEWAYTIDFSPFSRVDSRDANGFLRAKATVTAPGVYAYIRDGKLRNELKPAEEIFSPLHMASVHGAVVTDEHPPGAVAVTPQNSKELQRGHSMSAPTETATGMLVDLVVTDGALIEEAESGRKKGVSLGMRNTFEHKSGIWTAPNGSKHPYEVIQRNMVTNHIAIVSRPRVTSAQLHLDSLAQDEPQEQHMENQATVTIDGANFDVDTNLAKIFNAARGRDAEKLAEAKSKLVEATTSYDSLTVEKDKIVIERDKFEGERDALKEQIASTDAVDIDDLVLKRTNFLERARTVLSEDKLKPLLASKASDAEIMKFTCDSHDVPTEDKPEGYIEARFDILVSNKRDSNGDEFRLAAINPAVNTADSSVLKTQNDALAAARAGKKAS